MNKLKERINSLEEYLKTWLPLASSHSAEFYAQDAWDKLIPEEIREEVEVKTFDEVLDTFWNAAQNNYTPSSPIERFVQEARTHHLRVDGELCVGKQDALKYYTENTINRTSVDKFVSAKKGHEVEELMDVAVSLGGTHFVELGGGKGYLGEAIARCHGKPALTIDCDNITLNGGERRVAKIKKVLPKRSRDTYLSLHKFVNTYVCEDTRLADLVDENFASIQKDCEQRRIVITGLHTCGDLGSSSLRLFARERAHAVCNVPCCYHLLTEAGEGHGTSSCGFPMCAAIETRLGRNARMLASQSFDKVVSAKSLPSVGLHYRAILQDILKKHIPGFHIPERSLKGIAAKSNNFKEYYNKCVKKLDLNIKTVINFEEIENTFSSMWKKFVIFHLLRLCLAQVVESLILFDRLLFLRKERMNAVLVRLFDACKSPRCHAILAKT